MCVCVRGGEFYVHQTVRVVLGEGHIVCVCRCVYGGGGIRDVSFTR